MDLQASWCDPLDGEDSVAFAAFRFYRELYALTRSLEDVALELEVANEGITLARCRAWSTEFRWDARAAEYDAWLDKRGILRRQRVADARANLDDHKGSIGLSFLETAQKAGASMARDPEGVSATDAIKLARAAEELLNSEGSAVGETKRLGDRLETLDEGDLDQLINLLDKAGLDLDELS